MPLAPGGRGLHSSELRLPAPTRATPHRASASFAYWRQGGMETLFRQETAELYDVQERVSPS